MLQADFKLIETWQPEGSAGEIRGGAVESEAGQAPQQPMLLPCAVAAIGAAGDRRYTEQQLGAWERVAPPGGYEERWVEGEHK